MDLPLIGSYDLEAKPHSVQRTVNLIPVPQEPGNERTAWVLRDVKGLDLFLTEADSSVVDPSFSSVILLANFATDARDSSAYNATPTSTGSPTFSNGMTTGTADYVTWSGGHFNVTTVTLEAWVQYSTLASLNNEYLNIARLTVPSGTPAGLGWRYSDGRAMFNAGNVSGATPTVAADTPVHLCVYIPAGASPSCRFSIDGVDMGAVTYSGRDVFNGIVSGELSYPAGGYSYKVLAVRATEGDRYGSATFTPDSYPFPES